MNILLLDIDHTISSAAWRDDMIHNNDWDAYHLAGKSDEPIPDIVCLVQAMSAAWKIICVTGRPEKWRKQTMDWLISNNILVDEILMRPMDCFMSAQETKVMLLKRRFGEGLELLRDNPSLVLDDNDKVIEAMRGLGLTVLQVYARRS